MVYDFAYFGLMGLLALNLVLRVVVFADSVDKLMRSNTAAEPRQSPLPWSATAAYLSLSCGTLTSERRDAVMQVNSTVELHNLNACELLFWQAKRQHANARVVFGWEFEHELAAK